MANRRKSWQENIAEDFGWMGDPASWDMPDWLALEGKASNDYVPVASPPVQMTPEERIRAEQEARRAQIMQADAGLGSPETFSNIMQPIAPLGGVTGMGLSGGDSPVTVAPYGATPEQPRPPSEDVIQNLMKDDIGRGGDAVKDLILPTIEDSPFNRVPREGPRQRAEQAAMEGKPLMMDPEDFPDWYKAIPDNAGSAIELLNNPATDPLGTIDMVKSLTGGAAAQDGLPTVDASSGKDPFTKGVDGVPAFPSMPEGEHVETGGGTGSPSQRSNVELLTPVDTTPVKPNSMNAVQQFAADKLGWDEDKRGT